MHFDFQNKTEVVVVSTSGFFEDMRLRKIRAVDGGPSWNGSQPTWQRPYNMIMKALWLLVLTLIRARLQM